MSVLFSSSIIRTLPVFQSGDNIIVKKVISSTSYTNLSDQDCKYFDFRNISGIPPYIQVMVGQERIISSVETNFVSYHDKIVAELDRREFGNGLSIDLIRDEFMAPLNQCMIEMGSNIRSLREGSHLNSGVGGRSTGSLVTLAGFYTWRNDIVSTPRCCPQDF